MTMTIDGRIFVKPSEYRRDSVAVTSAVIAPASHNHTSHRLPGTDFLYRGQRVVHAEVTCCHTAVKIGTNGRPDGWLLPLRAPLDGHRPVVVRGAGPVQA